MKPPNGSDPLTGEDEGGDKSEHSSPEKKKVNIKKKHFIF